MDVGHRNRLLLHLLLGLRHRNQDAVHHRHHRQSQDVNQERHPDDLDRRHQPDDLDHQHQPDVVRLDADPGVRLKRMGCYQLDAPSDVEYPCPG